MADSYFIYEMGSCGDGIGAMTNYNTSKLVSEFLFERST